MFLTHKLGGVPCGFCLLSLTGPKVWWFAVHVQQPLHASWFVVTVHGHWSTVCTQQCYPSSACAGWVS